MMGAERFGRVALIGTGHIGGSLLLALRAASALAHAVGFDRDARALRRARERGIVDEDAASAAEAAAGAEVVVIATPVRAIPAVLAAIAPVLPPEALVMDVGS